MLSLDKADLKNKKVLVRVDFNVMPFTPREPRIINSLETIRFLMRKKARVILITHLETNEGKIPSALKLAKWMRERYFRKLIFVPDLIGDKAEAAVSRVKPGEILMLENLRIDPREKACKIVFAKRLASFADIYINEAFAASHRNHASIVLLPKFLPSYFGFRYEQEINVLSQAFKPPHPLVLILGGGKVDTKLPLLKAMLPKIDKAFLGGVIANKFLEKPIIKSSKIILPIDVVRVGDKIWDDGPETLKEWKKIIDRAKLVIWNGPLGFVENGYVKGTKTLVSILLKTPAKVIIGGGDTMDYLPKKLPKNIFVSTGGGAMLEFLVKKTLPGIEAIKH